MFLRVHKRINNIYSKSYDTKQQHFIGHKYDLHFHRRNSHSINLLKLGLNNFTLDLLSVPCLINENLNELPVFFLNSSSCFRCLSKLENFLDGSPFLYKTSVYTEFLPWFAFIFCLCLSLTFFWMKELHF